jgi:glycosyltransferase involved in cell wall biosynthesis
MPLADRIPTVGIVIPAYNEEDTIRACVQAAIHQTVPAEEIIVVDNKSTDQTRTILKKLKKEFPDAPLIVLRQDEAQGITPTRNMGFDAVTSDIIGRIDSDSVLEPNWVEETKKVFLNTDVHAATGPVIYYDLPLRRYMAKADDTTRRAISRLVKQYHFLFGTNMALRREAWEAVRDNICLDADREMFEDIDLSVGGLAELVNIDWCEVVAIDRGCTGSNGARRALCAVILVTGDAVFGSHVGRNHLQQIELGGHLKERTLVLRVAM